MSLGISLRRTLLIARRDFFGYIKTWGFWLTALGPFVGILVGALAPLLLVSSEPVQTVTILDESGQHAQAIEEYLVQENEEVLKAAIAGLAKYTIPRERRAEFDRILEEDGIDAAKDMIHKTSPALAKHLKMPKPSMKFIPPPTHSIIELKDYLSGKKTVNIDGEQRPLDGILYIMVNDRQPVVQYWTTKPTRNDLARLAKRYFNDKARRDYLAAHGIKYDEYAKAAAKAPDVTTLNPLKAKTGKDGQEVTLKDKIPYLVAAGFSMLLWFTVFTGAYMLLVSMVEEKINKVLEMLLASTRFSEIFFGKLLGVAALTLASLLPWIVLGAFGYYAASIFADGAIAQGLSEAISPQMLIFMPVFLLLGYVFYGSMFIAAGAMAESMQDASTLMTPLVLLLTACIMVVPIGIAYPDSPLLAVAAWVPFSAPFAAVIRLPSDPPLWQTLGSVLVLIFSSAFVVWGSGRLFKHGVLAGNGLASVKQWFGGLVKKRKKS